MKLAAIDIGSNGVRLLVGHVESGKLNLLFRKRAQIRFGADSFEHGEFRKKSFKEADKLFSDFKDLMKKEEVTQCLCVATSAFRDARNRKELIDHVESNYKITINTISGVLESDLIFNAIKNKLTLKDKYNLLIDIGGGSTEVKLTNGIKSLKTLSVDIGTVRLMQEMSDIEEFNDSLDFLEHEIQLEICPLLKGVDAADLQFIGTGGNLRRMGKLKKKLLSKYDTSYIKKKHFRPIFEKIIATNFEDRVNILGLREDRAEVIIPALYILKIISRNFNWDRLELPEIGLAHGVLESLVSGDHKLRVSHL